MQQAKILIWVFSPLFIYLAFFLFARRPTAVRISRIGQVMVILIAATHLAAKISPGALPPLDLLPTLICLGLGVFFWFLPRIWFVRLSPTDYFDLAVSACRRLFLSSSQSKPDELTLENRTRKEVLRVFPLTSKLLVTRLPPLKPRDKITLLILWLGKTLPGPLPQIKIKLKSK